MLTYGVGDLYVDDLSNSSLVRLCGENTVHGVSFGAGDLKEGVRTGKCVEVLKVVLHYKGIKLSFLGGTCYVK